MGRATVLLCLLFVISCDVFAQDSKSQSSAPAPKSATTKYDFEEVEVKGKGTNNFFYKVGELKNKRLLEFRPHFRDKMRESLDMLK